MTKTIEIELDDVHEQIYDDLVDAHGEESVREDIANLVQQSLYNSKYNN